VVAVMVVHEHGDWLEESLRGLSGQTYEALQYLILITGQESDPQARSILDTVATEIPGAVVRFLGSNIGFAASCNSVLNLVQGDSGFFCFLHDDVVLAPDAITRLLEELYRSNAGIVGPKLVHWDNVSVIQSVGIAADRFGVGLAMSDDGELDQEQHDAVQDVFYLSSACMLIRADLFRTVNGFNAELAIAGADLDLCWRCHTTGARVVVVPAAVARHRESMTSSIDDDTREDFLAASEKNRVLTVASLTTTAQLPFVLFQMAILTLSRFMLLMVTGRTRQAVIESRAFLGIVFSIPDLHQRRIAVAQYRSVNGNEIRALQLRGSAYVSAYMRQRARQAGLSQSESVGNVKVSSARGPYVMWTLLVLVLLVGSRSLLLHGVSSVGQMAHFDGTPRQLLASYVSGWWSAGLGQVSSLPTGIALVGVSGFITFGRMELLRTLMVVLLPLVGWIGMWRFASVLGTRSAKIAATVAYAAVPLPYASIAAGRWGALVLYAAVPWMIHVARTLVGHMQITAHVDTSHAEKFGELTPERWRRGFATLSLITAVTFAFEPSIILVVPFIAGVFCVVTVLHGSPFRLAVRWLGVLCSAVVVGLLLNVPWSITYVRKGWWQAIVGAPVESGRDSGLLSLAQFNVGTFTLSTLSLSLFIAVLGAVVLVRGARTAWALRGAAITVGGLLIAMFNDISFLPVHLAEPAIVLVPVAIGISICAGTLGSSLALSKSRKRFTWQRPLGALVGIIFSIGLLPLGVNSLDGSWHQPSLSLSQLLQQLNENDSSGGYRTLFLGDSRVLPGSPVNVGRGVSYSVVNGSSPSFEEMWETSPSRISQNAVDAVYGIVRGQTARAGRLLAPLAVRYIVVPVIDGGLSTRERPIAAPHGLVEALSRQLDFRRRYSSPDLVIFENAAWIPMRAQLTSSGIESSSLAGTSSMIASDISGATALADPTRPEESITLDVQPGTIHLAVPYTSQWKMESQQGEIKTRPAFGLTNAYDIPTVRRVTISFSGSLFNFLMVLGQFVAWTLFIFISFNRRRPKLIISGESKTLDDDVAIVMTREIRQ